MFFHKMIATLALVGSVFAGVTVYQTTSDSIAENQCYTVKGGTFYGPIGDPNNMSGPNYCFDADKRLIP